MRKRYYIIISLLISLFIYLFYRTEKTLVNELAIRIISLERYALLKEAVNRSLLLNELMIYSLPEGLWVFCITLTSKPYYIQLNKLQVRCVILPLILCVGLEVFQLLDLTNGRFDIMDIWISIIFWIIGNYAFSDRHDKQNILTTLNRRTMVCFATYGIVYLSHVLA